jgi:hypothetical protein
MIYLMTGLTELFFQVVFNIIKFVSRKREYLIPKNFFSKNLDMLYFFYICKKIQHMFKFNSKYSDIIIYIIYIIVIIILINILTWLNNDVGFMKGSIYSVGVLYGLITILGIYLIKLSSSIYEFLKNYFKSRN